MTRSPLVVDDRTTREQIQHEIALLRRDQREACIPSTAREYGAALDRLLDLLLALEPERV